MFLRRASKTDPLPVTMSGVRMGERLLQIGIDDRTLPGAIAAKVGLSGTVVMAVKDEREAVLARQAASDAGVLADVQVGRLPSVDAPDDAFDLAVIHSMRGLLAESGEPERLALIRECRRVLRPGGRILVVESGPREGVAAWLRPHRENVSYVAAGGSVAALEAGGFRPVRLLAERDGYRFVEGLRTGE